MLNGGKKKKISRNSCLYVIMHLVAYAAVILQWM